MVQLVAVGAARTVMAHMVVVGGWISWRSSLWTGSRWVCYCAASAAITLTDMHTHTHKHVTHTYILSLSHTRAQHTQP